MEDRIPALAHWLGSNALIFFSIATIVALAFVGAFWFVLVRYTAGAVARAAALWSRYIASRGFRPPARAGAAWAWLGGVLSAYALIAFVTALGATFLFIELADEIAPHEDVAGFDSAFTESLRASTSAETLALFKVITRLGDPPFLAILATIVVLVLLWRRSWWLTAVWITATGGNGLLTRILKALFERTRPIHDAALLSTDSWSFPSGHASGSFAVYSMLAYLLLRGRELRWWHLPLLVATTSLILMIGFSRVFLQVHYLSDVLAGYLVAASWVAVCITAAEMVRRSSSGAAANQLRSDESVTASRSSPPARSRRNA